MSTHPIKFPGNFLMPKSESNLRLDQICETMRSLEFRKDAVACLEEDIEGWKESIEVAKLELVQAKIDLAHAYSQPLNDRRKPNDEPNVTSFEFVCRIIEPSAHIVPTTLATWRVIWMDANGEFVGGNPAFTRQTAWASAFSVLDRRVGGAL